VLEKLLFDYFFVGLGEVSHGNARYVLGQMIECSIIFKGVLEVGERYISLAR
jgi:hypothetical protein